MNQLTLIQKEKLIEGIRYADSICHDHYKTDIKQFLEFLNTGEFQSLLDAIQEYIVHMERKGYAAQTFNKRIQAIKHRIRLLFELSPYSDSILRLF